MRISVTPSIALDPDELVVSFLRASGPGGQNVNKVETAVQLRFDVRGSPNLPDGVKLRLLRLAGRRATTEGVLVLTAQRFRSQERNRDDAQERLFALIREAAIVPERRIPTRATRGSKERRLEAKRRDKAVKAGRRAPPSD